MNPFKKVLLVDDDEAANFLAGEILNDMQAAKEIAVAEDGDSACSHVGRGSCPDIIFLDIRMPRMDGFNFLDYLSSLENCKNTKVVMLTSSSRREDREKALGYDNVLDYFEKPLTEEIVHKVFEEYYNEG